MQYNMMKYNMQYIWSIYEVYMQYTMMKYNIIFAGSLRESSVWGIFVWEQFIGWIDQKN